MHCSTGKDMQVIHACYAQRSMQTTERLSAMPSWVNQGYLTT